MPLPFSVPDAPGSLPSAASTVVVLAWNLKPREVEAGRSEIQSYPQHIARSRPACAT